MISGFKILEGGIRMKIALCYKKKEYCFLLSSKNYIFLFVLLTLLLCVSNVQASPKFLIMHLDAVCSRNFFRYMEEGDLPNLKDFFQDGHMIRHGLSLFPGGTETTVPHLKDGVNNSTGGVGWGYYDRQKDKAVSSVHSFFSWFSCLPRRAKASFIYGLPGLDPFLFFSFLNIPELLQTYNVIQFYWFTTDSLGHIMGQGLYEASIRRFDRYFGYLLKILDLTDLNIVIYCDHGMSFGKIVNTHQKDEITRIAGDELKALVMPNVYLKNQEKKAEIARNIVLDSEIDFTFYRENPFRVVGCWIGGQMIFEEKEGKIRYRFEGEDVLEYYRNGYQGEWLTDLQWLIQTKESKFPGVPPNIYHLMSNEKAGDIVIIYNPPKLPFTVLRYSANHVGVTETDLMVPILLKGPQLEHLYCREEMWLHNLYTSIPELSFEGNEPSREKNAFFVNKISGKGDNLALTLSLSPTYRWKWNIGYQEDIFHSYLEYDIYSSYFIRLWIGSGIKKLKSQVLPFMQTRLQMDFGKVQYNCGWQYDQNSWKEITKEISFQINDRIALEWHIPYGFGMSFSW